MVKDKAATLAYIVQAGDTVYHLGYINEQYAHIADGGTLSFRNTGGAVEALYNVLRSMFAKVAPQPQRVTIGAEEVTVTPVRASLNQDRVMVTTAGGGYFTLTAKQLNKLFGK
ncbi:hypothetical protein GCM10023184_17690 [Flaviaesturariibacter amylovorans]|uniref:LytTR family transcriptional regulator n=2 Tax=Flaviaesturariibacter amylovorans TaxID=1084520 RepID=A0ABP8GPZ5_9BACT